MQKSFVLSAENWPRIQDLLAEALELAPQRRDAFLDDACGADRALRREVVSLIDAYSTAENFLEPLDVGCIGALLDESHDARIGGMAGPYRIVRLLGRGGMGIVYLAEDTRLHRRVALKFLPLHLAADETARNRFLTEARAAAALDHLNIGVIHEVGETPEGETYIAMAYYEGGTLAEKIRRVRLPVSEVVGLIGQVAIGIREAHRHGSIHCDVKPSNILITPASGRGEAVIEELIGAICYGEPEPVENVRPDVPPVLEQIIKKCLKKSVGERYPDVDAFLLDLERYDSARPSRAWGTGGRVSMDRLLVLPLQNLSPEAGDEEYFASGITHELIARLSRLGGLRVIGGASSARYAGTNKRISEIGLELDVPVILSGSLREYLRDMGCTDEAFEEIRTAQELDPLSPYYLLVEGTILLMARRPSEASEVFDRLVHSHPTYTAVHFYRGLACLHAGQLDGALTAVDAADPEWNTPDALTLRGAVFARLGRTEEARSALWPWSNKRSKNTAGSSGFSGASPAWIFSARTRAI